MRDKEYLIIHPEEISVIGDIKWSKPCAYDVLLTGHSDENEYANFYCIVACSEKEWWTYYIGMVYEQYVSDRQRQEDHKKRLNELQKAYKGLNFNISLGVLTLKNGTQTSKKLIEEIEGLLIYANYHDEIVNKKKIDHFSSKKSFNITNTGFIDHLGAEEIVYGVVYRET